MRRLSENSSQCFRPTRPSAIPPLARTCVNLARPAPARDLQRAHQVVRIDRKYHTR